MRGSYRARPRLRRHDRSRRRASAGSPAETRLIDARRPVSGASGDDGATIPFFGGGGAPAAGGARPRGSPPRPRAGKGRNEGKVGRGAVLGGGGGTSAAPQP